jgi:hypothetical protein
LGEHAVALLMGSDGEFAGGGDGSTGAGAVGLLMLGYVFGNSFGNILYFSVEQRGGGCVGGTLGKCLSEWWLLDFLVG